MDNKERTFFVNQYTKLVISTWSDDAVARRLEADPRQTAADFGLRVPDDATVTLVRQIPSEGDHTPRLDFQIELWDVGRTSGVYELHIPETPQIDTDELDETELTQISGGAVSGVKPVGCCCCPCCCCT